MPLRDPSQGASYLHDSPRRPRSLSTASTRSLSTKRSPSPIITFTPAPLSSDTKGVKNITRKVIRTLEGLGHLDTTNMDEQDSEYDEKHDISEVEDVLNDVLQKSLYDSSSHQLNPPNISSLNSKHHLVHTTSPARETPKKIDWEIPRKLLHSSIGVYSLSIDQVVTSHFAAGFFTLYLYISESNVTTVVLILWTALAVILPADILRLRYPPFERMYERCLGFLMRESEKV